MNFDFNQQFKDYSTVDLLKIVKRPGEYQPTAVAAAERLLQERQVTPHEQQLVEQYFQDIDRFLQVKKEKADALKTKATDFFEPLLQPSEKVQPSKWVNILLLIIGVQYAWTLFQTVKRLINFFECFTCSFDITLFAETLTLFYIPLIFIFLFKRHRWGWILLFADNLLSLLSRLSQSYLFFEYQDIHGGDTLTFLLPILIKAAFVLFLWRSSIAGYFKITDAIKKKTAIVTAMGTLAFIVVIYLAV